MFDVKTGRVIFGAIVLIAVLIASYPMMMAIAGEEAGSHSRLVRLDEAEGGEIVEDLSDISNFEGFDNTTFHDRKIKADYPTLEDFESYNLGDSIKDQNGWTAMTGYDSGTFIAVNNVLDPYATNKGCRLESSSTSRELAMLSQPVYVTKGVFSIIMSTTKVDSDGVATTQVMLLGNLNNPSSSTDRVCVIGFNNNAISYYITSWNSIVATPSTNHRYTLVIEFDSSIHELNITVVSESGAVVGTANGVDYYNNYNAVQRVMLISGRNPSGNLVKSYFDEISILPSYPKPLAWTKPITIGGQMEWSYISTGQFMPQGTTIDLAVLDSTDKKLINWTITEPKDTLDMSPINSFSARTIKLRFTFNMKLFPPPYLISYTLEWHHTKAWRETFLMDERIETLSGLEMVNGHLSMTPSQLNGVYRSKSINIPVGMYWSQLKYTANNVYNSIILIDVLDAETNKAIPGYSDLTGNPIGLKGINPITYDNIKVRFRIADMGTGPELDKVAVTWIENTLPTLAVADNPNHINRTRPLTYSITVTDADQSPEDMWVSFKHRLLPVGSFEATYFTAPVFNNEAGFWESQFIPPPDALTGEYEIKISTSDEMGMIRDHIEIIEVDNNIPEPPVFDIGPLPLMKSKDVELRMVQPGTDIETSNLRYDIHFFLDGTEQMDQRLLNYDMNEPRTIPKSILQRGKDLVVEVYANDSMALSEVFRLSNKVLNSPPVLIGDNFMYILFDEDEPYNRDFVLSDYVLDIDEDDLEVIPESSLDIAIGYQGETSLLSFVPKADYYGSENITLAITDGEYTREVYLLITIRPVNDPPGGMLSVPEKSSYLVGELLNASATVYDTETASKDLSVTWEWEGKVIAQGPKVSFSLPEPGNLTVKCFVSDGTDKVEIGIFSASFKWPDPPFTPEQVNREYSSVSTPVIFEIIDVFGNSSHPSNQEIGAVNITRIGMRAVDRNVEIFMELASPPITSYSIPEGYGLGEWGIYSVFFVRSDHKEPQFDQGSFNLYQNRYNTPGKDKRYDLVDVEGAYLEYGGGRTSGNPVVEGSQIVWTIPIEVLSISGIPGNDINLFGSALYIKSSGDGMIAGFDTAGTGSAEHRAIPTAEGDNGDGGGKTVSMGLFLTFLIMVILIIIVLLAVSVLLFLRPRSAGPDRGEMEPSKEEAPSKEALKEAQAVKESLKEEPPKPSLPPPQPKKTEPVVPMTPQMMMAQRMKAMQNLQKQLAQSRQQAPPPAAQQIATEKK